MTTVDPVSARTLAPEDLTFSCVVDSAARYQLEAHYWVIALLEVAKVRSDRLVINFPGRVDPHFERWLAGTGVRTRRIERFPGSAYCNKLQQLPHLGEARSSHIVMTDCDTAVLRADVWPAVETLGAKMVDTANPPRSCIEQIFAAAGVGDPVWRRSDIAPASEGWDTEENNRNGGVYLLNVAFGQRLAPRWRAWAEWSLGRLELYGPSTISVDQVSLALAARELGADLPLLPRAFNYPTHLDVAEPADAEPVVIHHHHQYDDDVLIREVGDPQVSAAVRRLNDALRTHRSEALVERLGSSSRDFRDNVERVLRRRLDRLLLKVKPA